MAPAVWHGTEQERRLLQATIDRNCQCEYDGETGMSKSVCGAHRLFEDQRALDGLVFGIRSAATLKEEEFEQT